MKTNQQLLTSGSSQKGRVSAAFCSFILRSVKLVAVPTSNDIKINIKSAWPFSIEDAELEDLHLCYTLHGIANHKNKFV